MGKIEATEGQTLEFKREWTERALEDLAAFANTEGGRLLIGIRDDGEIVGAQADDRELQRIANLIAAHLGITPMIRVVEMQGLPVVGIQVEPAQGLVLCKGRYLRRVGTTNRDFSPEELARHILARSGRTWDGLPSDWSLEEADLEALKAFARLTRERLPHVDPSDPQGTLRNLNLLEGERLKNAGVLLFAKRPQRLFPQAQVRIGIFRKDEILDSHDFTGTLWEQMDGAMARFRQMLKVRFEIEVKEPSLEGLQRKEVWEYPLEALREALVNALIHRDYTYPADIQIRLEEDQLEVWSPGELPSSLTPELLYQPHSSVLRNPLIAQAFYFAGVIERWGTGTTRIVRLCREQGLPEPEFANRQGGFQVTFLKDPYTAERLRRLGLNERQIKAVMYVKEHGSIGNKEYQTLTGIAKATASRDLDDLVKREIFVKIGKTGRGTYYALKGSERDQRAHEGLKKDSKEPQTGQRGNKAT